MFSFFCPMLYLASPIYVEQIFDRVMYSRNVNTLLVLGSIATFMLAMYALLEWVRKKALVRIGNAIDERLSRVIFEIAHRSGKGSSRAPSILADFTTVREFLSGNSLTAIFDAFWSPLFIVVMIIVNWLFGVIAVFMIGATALLAVLNHRLSKADVGRYQKLSIKSQEFSQAVARNADTVRVLGMLPPLRDRWYDLHLRMLGWQSAATGRMEIFASATKFLRAYQMAGIFTVGTLLFLNNEVTLANTFVAMTLMTRGLGPIDQVVSNWKTYSNFLAAVARLDDVLRDAQEQPPKISLSAAPRDAGGFAAVCLCARRRPAAAERRHLQPRRGPRPRRHRPERRRQIVPGADPGRRMAAAQRQRRHRRSRSGPLERGRPRAPSRLHAAGYRTVARDDRRKHIPLRSGRGDGSRSLHRGRRACRHSGSDPIAAERLQHAGRAQRPCVVGRTAQPDRTGAGGLWRAEVCRAGRAEFQPGFAWPSSRCWRWSGN